MSKEKKSLARAAGKFSTFLLRSFTIIYATLLARLCDFVASLVLILRILVKIVKFIQIRNSKYNFLLKSSLIRGSIDRVIIGNI